jgi:ParB-like nuclease domain
VIEHLERRTLTTLIPYDNNPKKHSPEQIRALAKSIKEHGWTQPIVVDEDNVILAGHGRRLAALELGLTDIPVLVRADLTESQKKAVRIADNTIAALGELDLSALRTEVVELMQDQEFQFSLDDLGLGDFDFDLDDRSLESLLDHSESRSESGAPYPTGTGQGPSGNGSERPQRDYSVPDLSAEKQPVSLFQIVVSCTDEGHQREVYEYVIKAGYDAKVLTI